MTSVQLRADSARGPCQSIDDTPGTPNKQKSTTHTAIHSQRPTFLHVLIFPECLVLVTYIYLKEGGSTQSLSRARSRMSQSSRRPDNHGQSVEDVSADQDCSTDGEKKSKQYGLQPPSELSPQDGPIRSSATPVESQSHRIADRRSSNSAVEVQVPSTGRANRKSIADSAGDSFPIDGSRSAETQSGAVSLEDTGLKSLAQAATDRASGQPERFRCSGTSLSTFDFVCSFFQAEDGIRDCMR